MKEDITQQENVHQPQKHRCGLVMKEDITQPRATRCFWTASCGLVMKEDITQPDTKEQATAEVVVW